MANIFFFTDYRKFIAAWYAEKKQTREKITYRIIAEALGFNSGAHFLMIIRNKTNLSEERAKKLANFMGLNKKETTYFLQTVRYNQKNYLVDKRHALGKMVRLNKSGTVLLKPDQYKYYQKWYYAAIHDILSFYPFKGDCGELAKMVDPPLTRREAANAVALLERLQFVIKKEDGTYLCAYPGISAYAEGTSLALSAYAETMMDQARTALRKYSGDERSISWAGFSMSKKTFDIVKAEVREFRKRIVALAQSDTSPDRAYHLNIQMFPVSHRFACQEPDGGKK
jgi:uncharacterized protein (TIGR02147 family)